MITEITDSGIPAVWESGVVLPKQSNLSFKTYTVIVSKLGHPKKPIYVQREPHVEGTDVLIALFPVERMDRAIMVTHFEGDTYRAVIGTVSGFDGDGPMFAYPQNDGVTLQVDKNGLIVPTQVTDGTPTVPGVLPILLPALQVAISTIIESRANTLEFRPGSRYARSLPVGRGPQVVSFSPLTGKITILSAIGPNVTMKDHGSQDFIRVPSANVTIPACPLQPVFPVVGDSGAIVKVSAREYSKYFLDMLKPVERTFYIVPRSFASWACRHGRTDFLYMEKGTIEDDGSTVIIELSRI